MSGVRTRRQAAAISTPSTPTPAPREKPAQVVMNGNGAARGAVAERVFPKENIFLFWPNIIGKEYSKWCSLSSDVL